MQARRVWSDNDDHDANSDRLIAVKCSSGSIGKYEDSPIDQQWKIQEDGTIMNPASGRCLQELGVKNNLIIASTKATNNENMTNAAIGEMISNDYKGDLSFPSLYAVTTTSDCANAATKWDMEQFVGGKITTQ